MKTVFVTGGNKGIGAACCVKFAENGFRVLFTYNSDEGSASAIKKQLQEIGAEVEYFQLNITDTEACRALVERIIARFQIDVLVNNAGKTADNLFFWMTGEEWEAVIDTNLKGLFNITSPVVKSMIKNKNGNVINISSVSGVVGNPGQTNYSSSKAGIIGFTKSLAAEVARQNIRVNCVAPGLIETDMTAKLQLEDIKKAIPMKRIGKPSEVADVVFFLASKEASYITGEVINVSGGLVR